MAKRSNVPPQDSRNWSREQAYVLAAMCLLVGLAFGYFLRGAFTPAAPASSGSQMSSSVLNQPVPTPADVLPQQAAQKVAPLLERLKSSPNDPALLAQIGDAYYDAQQCNEAITYYERSLKLRPNDVNVRTDMGTCIWYTGDADRALAEYQKSLSYQPNHPNTLMNIGIVKLNGKNDRQGAIAAWQKLLDTNPNFPEKAKVLDMLAKARAGQSVP